MERLFQKQERLKDPKNEFHLERIADGKWNLTQFAVSPVFVREKFIRQPGEPTYTTWNYQQEWKEQALRFRLAVKGKEGSVSNIKIQLDNYAEIKLPVELNAGESVVCDGTSLLKIYDSKGKLKDTHQLAAVPPVVTNGSHNIIIDCSFGGEEPPKIEMQFKGKMATETCAISNL
jgi:hypothetical protein